MFYNCFGYQNKLEAYRTSSIINKKQRHKQQHKVSSFNPLKSIRFLPVNTSFQINENDDQTSNPLIF